jgi:dTMP kinase
MEKVVPALEAGKIVLCDRFVDSSIVYQGYARNIGMSLVAHINEIVVDGYMPHLTLFFDVTPETGMKRIMENLRKVNRLDLEEKEFHQKVYDGYHMLAKEHDRIQVIDGEKSKQEVFEQAKEVVEAFLDAESV